MCLAHRDRMRGIEADTPRILMVSDVFFPRVNGVSTAIGTFRNDLAALGCHSLLVAPSYATPCQDDPDTHRIAARRVPFDPEDRWMLRGALLAACRSLRGRFDLVHVQTPFLAHGAGVRLKRELGVKLVETYHTYFEEYFHHYVRFVPRPLLRRLARSVSRAQCDAADVIVAPSLPMADVLRAYGTSTRIEVIGTGLDMSVFERGDGARFRAAHGVAPGQPMLLTVSRAAFEKNIDFIVGMFADVARVVPDALLVIAGEGPALPALRHQAAALGLAERVRFVGYLERESALLDCYRAADAFVFASNTETQGLVLLEAMAVGTPVVSTAVLGTRAVLGDACPGAVIAPEDRAAFAKSVVAVLGDRSLRRRLGDGGRAFVRAHWSSRHAAARLLALYREIWRN